MTVTHEALMTVPLKLRLVKVLTAALFIVPVIVMFFSLRGVDMGLFMITQAIFRAGVITLEVPTGYLADSWSRKKTLLVGTMFYATGLGVMLFAYGLGMFIVAELLMAVGCVMYSGTVQALLYDALSALGKRHTARAELGKQRQWEYLSEGFSMVAGGVLFSVAPELPVLLTLLCFLAALGVLMTLTEPQRKVRKSENHLQDLSNVVRYAVHGHTEIRWLMVYPAVLMGTTIVPFWSAQKLMTDYGVSSEVFGFMLMANFLLRAVSARYAEAIERLLGLRTLAWLLLPAIISGFVILAVVQSPLAFVGMVICACSWSLGNIVFTDLVNRLLDEHAEDGDASDIRATVLSVFGLMQQLYGMAGLLLAGWLSPVVGIPATLLLIAALIAVAAMVPLIKVLQLQTFNKR